MTLQKQQHKLQISAARASRLRRVEITLLEYNISICMKVLLERNQSCSSCHLWNVDDLKSPINLCANKSEEGRQRTLETEGVQTSSLWPPGADLQTQLNSWHPITPQNFQSKRLKQLHNSQSINFQNLPSGSSTYSFMR